MGKLTWRLLPAHLPAQPSAAPASCLPARQAGRCPTATAARATHLLAASPLPSPGDVVDQPPSLPRTPQTPPLLSSSSPSRSPAMTDATTAVPTS